MIPGKSQGWIISAFLLGLTYYLSLKSLLPKHAFQRILVMTVEKKSKIRKQLAADCFNVNTNYNA